MSADVLLKDRDYDDELDPAIRRLHTTTTKTKYSLKQLQEHHREMVRLSAAGFNTSQIAEHLGVHINTVNNCLNNPLVKEAIVILRARRDDIVLEARDIIREKAKSLVENLIEIGENPLHKAQDRIKAIDSALDRAGLSRIQKVENTTVTNTHTTIEHIKKIAGANATPNPNIDAIEVVCTTTDEEDGVNNIPDSYSDDFTEVL